MGLQGILVLRKIQVVEEWVVLHRLLNGWLSQRLGAVSISITARTSLVSLLELGVSISWHLPLALQVNDTHFIEELIAIVVAHLLFLTLPLFLLVAILITGDGSATTLCISDLLLLDARNLSPRIFWWDLDFLLAVS